MNLSSSPSDKVSTSVSDLRGSVLYRFISSPSVKPSLSVSDFTGSVE